MQQLRSIIISRTDSIGDVVLTLPVAKALKENYPEAEICFLGKSYTRPVIEACRYVDCFIDPEDFMRWEKVDRKVDCIIHIFPVAAIAKKAKSLGIPLRIGTTNRLYHWTTCNKLVSLSRKNSDLHEAVLNLQLLNPLDIQTSLEKPNTVEACGLTAIQPLAQDYNKLLDPKRANIILHPKSQGSAREWGILNFIRLIELLGNQHFNIFISGTANEKAVLQPIIEAVGSKVTDITGLMSLTQFMAFIQHCDGLVANSTGPLHIAAAMGKHAFGIYPPMRPIHPGRWAPVGPHVHIFVKDNTCNDCRKNPQACHCMQDISPEDIA